jgi:hypothetical protein
MTHVLLVSLSGSQSPLKRPRAHNLPTLLLDLPQLEKLPSRPKAGLLFKLTPRGNQRILVRLVFTLGNRPRAFIFLGPKRSPGMDQKDLYLILHHAKHQKTRAALRPADKGRSLIA